MDFKILNTDYLFLNNIQNYKLQNLNQEIMENYNKQKLPDFKLAQYPNVSPAYFQEIKYKNKSFFGVEKPIQTENDEIGVNQAYLNAHYGYRDYGNYKVQNISLENQLIKKTPKENIYEIDFLS